MTLNQLIEKATKASYKLSSGDVPIVFNNIHLPDMDFSIEEDVDGIYVRVKPIYF